MERHISQRKYLGREFLNTSHVSKFCRDKNRLIYGSFLPLKIFSAFTKSLGTYHILWLSLKEEFQ